MKEETQLNTCKAKEKVQLNTSGMKEEPQWNASRGEGNLVQIDPDVPREIEDTTEVTNEVREV